MKAIVNVNKHQSNGKVFQVSEFTGDKRVILSIDGNAELFTLSELTLVTGDSQRELFYAGKALSTLAYGFRDNEIHDAAKKCARSLGLTIKFCRNALSTYNFG